MLHFADILDPAERPLTALAARTWSVRSGRTGRTGRDEAPQTLVPQAAFDLLVDGDTAASRQRCFPQ
jgi:hypothetical protein